MTSIAVVAYLGAAVAANLTIASLGPWAMPAVGFLMIGFDLTARDYLHERWEHRGLAWRMAALVACGSALTYLANQGALRVAAASAASFGISATVDTLVYQGMSGQARIRRMLGSNLASSLADSLVFPIAAFGIALWYVSCAQWVAKFAGGACWAWLIDRHERRSCGR